MTDTVCQICYHPFQLESLSMLWTQGHAYARIDRTKLLHIVLIRVPPGNVVHTRTATGWTAPEVQQPRAHHSSLGYRIAGTSIKAERTPAQQRSGPWHWQGQQACTR